MYTQYIIIIQSIVKALFSGPQFEQTGLGNVEQSLYLCILWF